MVCIRSGIVAGIPTIYTSNHISLQMWHISIVHAKLFEIFRIVFICVQFFHTTCGSSLEFKILHVCTIFESVHATNLQNVAKLKHRCQ